MCLVSPKQYYCMYSCHNLLLSLCQLRGQVQTKQIARRLSTLQILPHCILQGAIPHLRSSMSVPACLPAYNNFKRTPFRLHQHQPPQNCVTVTVHPSSCLWRSDSVSLALPLPLALCACASAVHRRCGCFARPPVPCASTDAVFARLCRAASARAVRVRWCHARPPVPCASASARAVRVRQCRARPPVQCASTDAVRVRRCRARPPVPGPCASAGAVCVR